MGLIEQKKILPSKILKSQCLHLLLAESFEKVRSVNRLRTSSRHLKNGQQRAGLVGFVGVEQFSQNPIAESHTLGVQAYSLIYDYVNIKSQNR
ncbi:MAG: hypothetical protein CSB23_04955 [Deltaproteobacteria bacterium]|nr:MAG: hypothetical protein CSB23_04955 [Deltaproteobacteria bacterium]